MAKGQCFQKSHVQSSGYLCGYARAPQHTEKRECVTDPNIKAYAIILLKENTGKGKIS